MHSKTSFNLSLKLLKCLKFLKFLLVLKCLIVLILLIVLVLKLNYIIAQKPAWENETLVNFRTKDLKAWTS